MEKLALGNTLDEVNLKSWKKHVLSEQPYFQEAVSLLLSFIVTSTTNVIFFFLAAPCSMQDLSSPTRAGTHAPYSGSTES